MDAPNQPPQGDAFDVRRYLAVLRRRWLIILFTTVLVVAAAMAVTYRQTPLYRSSVHFVVGTLIDPTGTTTTSDILVGQWLGQQQLESQTAAIESVPVAERVVDNLGLDVSPTSLLSKVDSELTSEQVLVVEAVDDDPELAATLAQGFVDSYLEARNDAAVDNLLRNIDSLERRRADTESRLSAANAEIDATAGTVDGDQSTVAAPSPAVDPQLLLERDQLVREIGQLDDRISELEASQPADGMGGQVLRPAQVPSDPFSPQPIRNGGLALVLGLTLGAVLAFVRDHLDDAIRSEADIAEATSCPVLGRIPRWAEGKNDRRLVTLVEPTSVASEAYRTLRTTIRFLSLDTKMRSMMVTSPMAGEGKTTVAANLAVAMATLGKRVILVDADMRRPTINQRFGLPGGVGLSDVVADEVSLDDALVDVGIEDLRILPCGPVPPRPAELLASTRMARVMADLAALSDVVVYDSPPLLAVSDGLELATRVDETLLVIDQGESGRHALRSAIEHLRTVGVDASGIVMNNLTSGGGYDHYYTQYQHDAPTNDTPGRRRGKDTPGRRRGKDASPDSKKRRRSRAGV